MGKGILMPAERRKIGPVHAQLNRTAPDGIDVYFDNAGGESLDAVLSALRIHGRTDTHREQKIPRPLGFGTHCKSRWRAR